jgi:uncharacterized metal-binding protein YceD (DUF177 family)
MLIKLVEVKQSNINIIGEIDLSKNDKSINYINDISGKIKYHLTSKKVNDKNIYLLVLHIYGKISTLCQVCINKFDYDMDQLIEVPILNSEVELNDIIESHNDNYDAFTINQEIDLEDFVIDEVIMNMPIVFKHDIC